MRYVLYYNRRKGESMRPTKRWTVMLASATVFLVPAMRTSAQVTCGVAPCRQADPVPCDNCNGTWTDDAGWTWTLSTTGSNISGTLTEPIPPGFQCAGPVHYTASGLVTYR